MPTTAQDIITAAINRSLANDNGETDLASSSVENLAVLSRLVRRVFALAALPGDVGGFGGRTDYFTRTQTVTLGTPATTPVALPSNPEFARITSITNAGGQTVNVVTLRDLRDNVAEYPPAVVIADQTIRSAGRNGDPTAGAVLTLDGVYLPPDMTALTHVVGATTPADASTSKWPEHAGNEWLIASMARYYIIKDGLRDAGELAAIDAELEGLTPILAATIGVAPARLSTVRAA